MLPIDLAIVTVHGYYRDEKKILAPEEIKRLTVNGEKERKKGAKAP